MTNIILLKMVFLLAIFFSAIIGGKCAQVCKKHKSESFLHAADFFARGIFLGIGLLHLLPDAINYFSVLKPDVHYPVVLAICTLTIFLIQLLEKYTSIFLYRHNMHVCCISFILVLLLSTHSIIEGASLGISYNLTALIMIFVAIIAHKGTAAFAIITHLQRNDFNTKNINKIINIFACMTPIGIVIGSAINIFITNSAGHLFMAIFNAIAAGTFIYIGTFDIAAHEDEHKRSLWEFFYFGIGIFLMAIIAVFL